MTKFETCYFNLHFRVQSVCNLNEVILATIIAYFDAKLKYDANVVLEKEIAQRQESYKTTSVQSKKEARATASTPLLDLSSKIMSYSLVKGKTALYNDVKLTKTSLNRVSDQQFILIHVKIVKIAEDNLEDLEDQQVTAKTITDNKALLAAFVNEIQIVTDRNSASKQATHELKKQIKVTNASLKVIDSIINSLQLSKPNLYSEYWSARAIKHTSGCKISVKGKVYDAETNQALMGATLTFTPDVNTKSLISGADLVKIVKVSSAGGGFHLKNVPDGAYTGTVVYYGYADRTFNAYVNNGQITMVMLPLTKLPD